MAINLYYYFINSINISCDKKIIDKKMSTTDCLMLCFDDNHYTKVFVFYDSKNNVFEIRGKNKDTKNTKFHPFSFTCKNISSLYHFLFFHFRLKETENSISLYNYDHLPETSNDVTYDFLELSQDSSYEIFAYEQYKITQKRCKKILKMLKNIMNEY